jgi:hypothetical protein
MTIIRSKYGNDWCHLCGKRATVGFAEIHVPENAEHSTKDGNRGFFRFCQPCVAEMDSKISAAYQEAMK